MLRTSSTCQRGSASGSAWRRAATQICRYHVEIQEPGSDAWTNVGTGTVIGWRNLIRLNPPRMAQKAALVIEQARGVPAVSELGLY